MASLLFFFSVNLFLVLFILIKKKDKPLSIIKWVHISIILLFCINSIIAFVLSYIHIPTNLYSLSIVFLIISGLIYMFFIKNKCIQKYYFNKNELVVSICILVFSLVIAYIRFGFPFSLSYVTFDPGVHFESAKGFYEESFLLNFRQSSTLLNYETWRFASYTNVGILFKFLSFIIPETQFYNLYIIYDIATIYMTGVLFYFLINNNKKFNLFKLIGTIIFLLGYPLNNLFIGFFYVGHATNIIICILLYISECDDLKMLPILNLGLVFTYYLFIPFIFLAQFIYLFRFRKEKKLLYELVKLFVIPIICWFVYFVLPTFTNTDMDLINQIQIDGLFYNDVIGNFLLFIPIISSYIYILFKKDKYNVEVNMFCILFIMLIIFNIMMLLGVIRPYYISKYYYILWLLSFVLVFRSIDLFYKKYKFVIINYIVFVLFVMFWGITKVENKIINLNTDEWNLANSTSLFSVYNYNINVVKVSNTVFEPDELNDVTKLQPIDSFYTNGATDQILWLLIFTHEGQIDCPVNNAYDCITNKHKLDFYEFFYQNDVDTYIYLDRNLYWPSAFIPETDQILIDSIDYTNYNLYSYNFGYVIQRK